MFATMRIPFRIIYWVAFVTWCAGHCYIFVVPTVVDPPGFSGTGLDGGLIPIALQIIHPDRPDPSSIGRSSQYGTPSVYKINTT